MEENRKDAKEVEKKVPVVLCDRLLMEPKRKCRLREPDNYTIGKRWQRGY